MTKDQLTKQVSAQQQGPPSAEEANAEIRLKGHLGHLTPEEQKAFTEFKEICTQKGFYTPPSADTKASHDDGTLIRYLRARKFVPQDAYVQFSDTEKWRKDNDLDALYEKIDIKDYRESRSVYPQWTGRRDKRGIPVYLYEVHKLDSKKMVAYSSSTTKSKHKGPSDSRMLRLFALYENLTRFVMPLCSAVPGRPNPETPVDQSNNIVDISKVGLKQFWNLKSHMQDASTLATAHYPETLDRIFILGAPSFFPTVWGWVKRWFDPITTSKMFILSQHQILPTLSQFMDVEAIPKKYGGKLDFECGMMPSLDPQIRQCMSIEPGLEELFLTAPVRWIDAGDDGEMTALGVGSIDGQQRKEQVATLHSMATRVATNASNFQSQRTQDVPDISHATTDHGATIDQPSLGVSDTAPMAASAVNAPVSNTTTQPPEKQMADLNMNDKAINPVGNAPLRNGGPPEGIAIPPASTEIERTKTEFVTPPADQAELKQLQ